MVFPPLIFYFYYEFNKNKVYELERILFQLLQVFCLIWGAKPVRFWFSSDVGGQDFYPLGLTPWSCIFLARLIK